MYTLFWIFLVVDLLLLGITIVGKDFRSGYGAGISFNFILMILLFIALVAGLMVRFGLKQKGLSVIIVSLPFVAMLLLYAYEKISGKSV